MRRRRWEQRFNIRPAQKSMSSRPRRARYTQEELDAALAQGMDVSFRIGEAVARRRCEEEIRRLMDGQEILGVAEAAGVTPLDDSRAGEVGDDAEEWLANREQILDLVHEEAREQGTPCPLAKCRRCERDSAGG